MKKIFKAILAIGIIGAMALGFTACGGNGGSDAIAVISREEGSGTRGAFVELTGVEVDKVDKTVVTAEISSSTAVVMQTVVNGKGRHRLHLPRLPRQLRQGREGRRRRGHGRQRQERHLPHLPPVQHSPRRGDLSDAAKDFIAFIQSDEGQQVVTDKGCVSTGSTGAFTSGNPTGTVVIEGSSSVTPVVEKSSPSAYMAINSADVTGKVQQSDSLHQHDLRHRGLCDIGISLAMSRTAREGSRGLDVTTICMDGIAVVVNNDSTVDNLSLRADRQIFTGEVTGWP